MKMDKAAAAFRAIDTDNSGFLDREEFLKFTRFQFINWLKWRFLALKVLRELNMNSFGIGTPSLVESNENLQFYLGHWG